MLPGVRVHTHTHTVSLFLSKKQDTDLSKNSMYVLNREVM